MYEFGGTVTVENSTFSGNSVNNTGNAIYTENGGIATVTNSTFSGNYGGSASMDDDGASGTFYLAGNIFEAGVSGINCLMSTLYDNGYNLSDDSSCGFSGTSADNATLNLGPLTDNGGPTQTHAPGAGSDAIDAIPYGTTINNNGTTWTCSDTDPFTDQSGVTRPQGAGCDIGAYETEITNLAPTADPGGPYLGAINTSVQFDGSASYEPEADSLTYTWDFGDGNNGSGVMPSHDYTETGVYDVCLIVNDGMEDSASVCTIAVVYDPSAGFVTGGGWIISPEGVYTDDPSLSGKATFGFVSKYKKGASVPTGNTSFIFDLAGFEFYSDTYEWLVVNGGGTNAQFKGSGTVNDGLDPNGNPYKFMLWAGDGSPDTFRIHIWWEANGVETVIYDNGSDQPIGPGNIVVHKGK